MLSIWRSDKGLMNDHGVYGYLDWFIRPRRLQGRVGPLQALCVWKVAKGFCGFYATEWRARHEELAAFAVYSFWGLLRTRSRTARDDGWGSLGLGRRFRLVRSLRCDDELDFEFNITPASAALTFISCFR